MSAGQQLTVGVLGGMGPDATVDLLQRIIDLTPARDDADHIHVLVDNNPKVPSRIAAIIEGTGPSPAPAIIRMAQGLEAQGADFLVMPCNTAHHYHAQVAAAVDIPFLNLPALVAGYLSNQPSTFQRVGVLGSSALQLIHLYESHLQAAGMQACYPGAGSQAGLMDLIRAVKRGSVNDALIAELSAAVLDLENQQVDVFLVACTELSVIAKDLQASLPIFDAADILARAVVERALAVD